MPGPPKFQITSRKWNVAAVVGSILILAIGFGGLFYIQKSVDPTGGVMLAVVIAFGILTALLFVGPGALYPFRKRTAFGKKIMRRRAGTRCRAGRSRGVGGRQPTGRGPPNAG